MVSVQEQTQTEWVEIARRWCELNEAELLFVNTDNFGCWKNGRPLHIYATELYDMLKNERRN